MGLPTWFSLSVCLLVAWVKLSEANLLIPSDVTTESSHHVVLEKWRAMDKNMRIGVETMLAQLLPILVKTSGEINVSPDCMTTIFKMVLALRQMKGWAFLMLDASAKLPTGVFSGTSADMGNFDQCVNISVRDEGPDASDPDKVLFQGRYCTVEMKLPVPTRARFNRLNEIIKPLDNFTTDNFVLEESRKIAQFAYFLSYRLGICVPSTCSHADIDSVVKLITKRGGTYGRVKSCELKEELKFDNAQIGVLAMIAFFGLMCFVGTTVDVFPTWLANQRAKNADTPEIEKPPKVQEMPPTVFKRVMLAFSVPRNCARLLNTDGPGDHSVDCLHGVRFLSMIWVIVGHTYLFLHLQILRNFAFIRWWSRDFTFQVIINGLVGVDSFFFISGFLVCYLTVKYVDANQGKGLNIPIMFIRRVLRLLPSTLIVIYLGVMIPIIGSGPTWHETVDFLSTNCRKYWWSNALFINNFFAPKDICLPQTWYSAVDMQLFLVAIVFFLFLFKNESMGLGFNMFMIIGSIIITSAINYFKDLPPTMLMANPDPSDMVYLWTATHFLPNGHYGPYGMGLALGVILARRKGPIKITPTRQVLGWSSAIAINYAVVFSAYEWNRDTRPGIIISILYSGLHRTAWGYGIAWMTYACAAGYGGIVNTILSWKAFVPLSKLTFLAYLWHFQIIFIHQGSQRGNYDSDHFLIVWDFFGHCVAAFGLALISYHLFEAPIGQLERILFSGLGKPTKKAETTPSGGDLTIGGGNQSLASAGGGATSTLENSSAAAVTLGRAESRSTDRRSERDSRTTERDSRPAERGGERDYRTAERESRYSQNRNSYGMAEVRPDRKDIRSDVREMIGVDNGRFSLVRDSKAARSQLPDGAVNGTFIYKM